MKQIIAALIDILQQECKLYEELLSLSQEKADIIIKGNVPELEQITKTEHQYISVLTKLELERENRIDALAQALGESAQALTLQNVAEKTRGPQASELTAMRDRISVVLHQLKESNEANTKLIRNSMEYIHFSIGLLSSVGSEDNNYNPNAEKTTGKSRNVVDFKV